MFEKEAGEYKLSHTHYEAAKRENGAEYAKSVIDVNIQEAFRQGAEFGYNEANKWRYAKDKLPPENVPLLCIRGGNIYIAWYYDSVYHDSRCCQVKKPYAWKEIELLKEIKEELKDEMKNRISLALKDTILQQGFEVICKEHAELTDYRLPTLAKQQTENQKYTVNLEHKLSWYDDQLTKAKEIIKELYEGLDKLYLSGLSDKQIAFIERLQDKTEQYFKGDMICLRKNQKKK